MAFTYQFNTETRQEALRAARELRGHRQLSYAMIKRSHRILTVLLITCLLGLIDPALSEGRQVQHQGAMLEGMHGWEVTTLLTVGQRFPSTGSGSSNDQYQPVGILDGLGAFQWDEHTVRLLVNHELTKETGYAYRLRDGITPAGARVSFFDVDRRTQKIVNSGLAYDTIRDRQGHRVMNAQQINEEGTPLNGFSRFCSAHLVLKGTYGFSDTIFFTGEEASDPLTHPHGGTLWALDVEDRSLHAVSAAGRMVWENAAPLHMAGEYIGLLIGDDTRPQTDEHDTFGEEANSHTPAGHVVTAPLWLYLGKKNASIFEIREALPAGTQLHQDHFLNRNGLLVGELFYFVADGEVTSVKQFKGTGSVIKGTWRKMTILDRTQAEKPGFDRFGYKDGFMLRREAKKNGSFQFSRPEDVSTHPVIGTRVAFASTGRDRVFPAHDEWGTIYQVDVDVATLSATIRILYDGDDAGGQFKHPDDGIRNPDNLDWSEDGFIYVQEDGAKQHPPLFGSHSGIEASIWRLNPETGKAQRIAQMNRSVALPRGSTDHAPDSIGQWESSGIIDVTELFDRKFGERLLLATVQAHTIKDGMIQEANLVEGGQLILLKKRF